MADAVFPLCISNKAWLLSGATSGANLLCSKLITALLQQSCGDPLLLLRKLLGFDVEDALDLRQAVIDSGCTYVELIAAYLHNLAALFEDNLAGAAFVPKGYEQGVADKAQALLQEIAYATRTPRCSAAGGDETTAGGLAPIASAMVAPPDLSPKSTGFPGLSRAASADQHHAAQLAPSARGLSASAGSGMCRSSRSLKPLQQPQHRSARSLPQHFSPSPLRSTASMDSRLRSGLLNGLAYGNSDKLVHVNARMKAALSRQQSISPSTPLDTAVLLAAGGGSGSLQSSDDSALYHRLGPASLSTLSADSSSSVASPLYAGSPNRMLPQPRAAYPQAAVATAGGAWSPVVESTPTVTPQQTPLHPHHHAFLQQHLNDGGASQPSSGFSMAGAGTQDPSLQQQLGMLPSNAIGLPSPDLLPESAAQGPPWAWVNSFAGGHPSMAPPEVCGGVEGSGSGVMRSSFALSGMYPCFSQPFDPSEQQYKLSRQSSGSPSIWRGPLHAAQVY